MISDRNINGDSYSNRISNLNYVMNSNSEALLPRNTWSEKIVIASSVHGVLPKQTQGSQFSIQF